MADRPIWKTERQYVMQLLKMSDQTMSEQTAEDKQVVEKEAEQQSSVTLDEAIDKNEDGSQEANEEENILVSASKESPVYEEDSADSDNWIIEERHVEERQVEERQPIEIITLSSDSSDEDSASSCEHFKFQKLEKCDD